MYGRGGSPGETGLSGAVGPCFVVAVVAMTLGAWGCRTRPAEDPQTASVVRTECTNAPADGCTRERLDLDRCAQLCRAGDPASCVVTAEHGRDLGAAGRDVLEAVCARDPVCGCAWLGWGLSWIDEPAAQHRALEVSARACDLGADLACDNYDLYVSGCLQQYDGPACDDLRAQGKLPVSPPPRTHAFGCHWSRPGPLDPEGPRVAVCLAEDRISVRDAAGRWEQWRVENWHREDTPQQAIWVADGVESPSIRLAAASSSDASAPASGGSTYYVGTGDGLLQLMLEADRDDKAERRLATLPPVEEMCLHADACEMEPLRESDALGEREDDDHERLIRPPPGPQTWRHCHRRWSAAAQARLEYKYDTRGGASLPPICGAVEFDDMLKGDPEFDYRVHVPAYPTDLVLQPPFATDHEGS